jgi:hypothetical protein
MLAVTIRRIFSGSDGEPANVGKKTKKRRRKIQHTKFVFVGDAQGRRSNDPKLTLRTRASSRSEARDALETSYNRSMKPQRKLNSAVDITNLRKRVKRRTS